MNFSFISLNFFFCVCIKKGGKNEIRPKVKLVYSCFVILYNIQAWNQIACFFVVFIISNTTNRIL